MELRTLSLITSGALAKCSLSAGKSMGEMPNHGDLIASLPLREALAGQPAWLLQARCSLSPCPCPSALALSAGLLQQISLLRQACRWHKALASACSVLNGWGGELTPLSSISQVLAASPTGGSGEMGG